MENRMNPTVVGRFTSKPRIKEGEHELFLIFLEMEKQEDEYQERVRQNNAMADRVEVKEECHGSQKRKRVEDEEKEVNEDAVKKQFTDISLNISHADEERIRFYESRVDDFRIFLQR